MSKFLFGLLAAATLVLSSCRNEPPTALSRQLNIFRNSTIVFPETMLSIGERSFIPASLHKDRPKMVFYADSSNCLSCVIARVRQYRTLIETSKKTGAFQTVFVLSPDNIDYHEISELLGERDLRETVFLDTDRTFKELNPSFPENPLFNAFLIDSEGHPILVGNPVVNNKIKSLFCNILNISENGTF